MGSLGEHESFSSSKSMRIEEGDDDDTNRASSIPLSHRQNMPKITIATEGGDDNTTIKLQSNDI